MKWRFHRRERCEGSASVEFAIIAPVLVLAVLSTADIGLAVHESFEVDQTLRNGAEAALRDMGEAGLKSVLAAVDEDGSGHANTTWSVTRYCACPETSGNPTSCSTTCGGSQPTAIFYDLKGVRAYPGIIMPARNLTRSASVQVR